VSLRGSTAEFPLDVVLRLLGDSKKTGQLTIRGNAGDGSLGIADGRVVAALFSDQSPIPALGSIFQMGDADFEFVAWSEAPSANLEGELDENLRKAEEYRAWLARVREVIPHDGIRFRLSEKAADHGAVTFTPDRWRVIMAMNTQPDVNQVATQLRIDRDGALDILSSLVRDGVIETVVPAPEPTPPPPAPGPPPAAEKSAVPAAEPEAAPEAPTAQEPRAPQDWSVSLLPQQTAEAEPDSEDRLSALEGLFEQPPTPRTNEWSTPAADSWSTPAEPATPSRMAEEDEMRLAALQAKAAEAPPVERSEPTERREPIARSEASEWAPPPLTEAPPAPKKGLLGGIFGRAEPAPAPAGSPMPAERVATSRAGQLAAFSNALLAEYNSGQYGKGRVDDRIPRLLMRVDEQADPIDRPLPVVDDRLDVQALERVSMPEAQAVPYLALLVSTIYGDAEKAFGRDKAKRGYRAAQQHTFGGDTAALAGPDIAGKLPKI
jgi:hypothetical protein